jgi:hypothetical protein
MHEVWGPPSFYQAVSLPASIRITIAIPFLRRMPNFFTFFSV